MRASVMKTLLVIFAIYVSSTLGEETTEAIKKHYPKKYGTFINGKILINAAKYENTNTPVAKSYTAFQLVGINPKLVQDGVPDSPYFPVDKGYEQKVRVKKILPLDYPWSLLRNKRSAALNVSSVEKEDKNIETKASVIEKEVKETTPIPTAGAAETTVEKSSSPKELQEEPKSTTKISNTKSNLETDNTEKKRAGTPLTNKNKAVQKEKARPKSKAVPKKNNGRVNRNAKSKLKRKGAATGRAKPKGKQSKYNKPKVNQTARKKDKTRPGNKQKGKKQKAKPNKAPRAGKTSKGKSGQAKNKKKNPK